MRALVAAVEGPGGRHGAASASSSGLAAAVPARCARRCCTWCGGACCAQTCRCRCRPTRCWSVRRERLASGPTVRSGPCSPTTASCGPSSAWRPAVLAARRSPGQVAAGGHRDAAGRCVDPGARGGDGAVPAPMGSVLDDLSDGGARELAERLGHVREVLTGYRSGSRGPAGPGEPRPEYRPVAAAEGPLPGEGRRARRRAVRTVERWVAALRDVRSDRARRRPQPAWRSIRWLGWTSGGWRCADWCWRSTPTRRARPRSWCSHRVSARLDAPSTAPGVVPVPGRRGARAVLAELTRGSNALRRQHEAEAVDRGPAARRLRPAAADPAGRVPAAGHHPAGRVRDGAAHAALGRGWS